MKPDRRWLVYLGVGGALTLSHFMVPRGSVAQSVIFQFVALSAVLAVWAGVRRHAPRSSRPWLLLGVGLGLWFVGDGIWAIYDVVLHSPIPEPSVADPLYLLGYAFLGVGVWLLGPIVEPGRRTELFDVVIVWLSLGIVIWTWQGEPVEGSLSLATAIGLAYPLMDVVLIGGLARIALVRGARSPSHLLLLGGMSGVLLADLVLNALTTGSGYLSGDPIDAGWLLGYVLIGAAALHPSMRELTRLPDPRRAPMRATRPQLVALGVAAVAPVAILGLNATGAVHVGTDQIVITLAITTANVVLLVLRLAALLREAKDTSDTLADSEQRHRSILDNSLAGVLTMGPDLRVTYVNPAAARMFGYASPDSLLDALKRHPEAVYTDPDDRALVGAHAVSGSEDPLEIRFRRADGSTFWGQTGSRVQRDEAGEPRQIIAMMLDVTARREAEARAQVQHEHLQLLQSGAAAANEAASAEEAMQTVLDEVCVQTGWPLGHIYLRPDALGPLVSSGLWHDADPLRFVGFREVTRNAPAAAGVGLAGTVLARGRPSWTADIDEHSLYTRTPSALAAGLCSAAAFPVRIGREVVAVLELFSPDRREPDEELMRVLTNLGTQLGRVVERARAEHALRDAYEREREASQRLLALDEMKNSILTAVSHELRTPLTAVYGFAELLESDGSRLSAEQFTMVTGRLAENARRLDRLVADLLDLDRLTRGIVEPRLETIDLSLLAHQVIRESGAFEIGRIALHGEPVTIAIDRARVERILENLVSNALRYSPPGTPVDVTVAPDESGARIVVEDRGPGVPLELRAAVFEPFRHGPNAVKHSPGVGIGLSLVARFANLHGGRAWVEDREGGGARFVVFLPDRSEPVPGPPAPVRVTA